MGLIIKQLAQFLFMGSLIFNTILLYLGLNFVLKEHRRKEKWRN